MVRYRRNQEILMQTPPSVPAEFTPDTAAARATIANALVEGRTLLGECEAKEVLAAYAISAVEGHVVEDLEQAMTTAHQMGFPVVLKIISPDIIHKSDVGGVALNLRTPRAVGHAARAMVERLHDHNPAARLEGYCVQRMVRRPHAYELIVGMTVDPTFGPVILFGHGGTAAEVIGDRAMALPPLNMHLAKELISRTRIYKLLQGYSDHPPANLDAICLTLMQVSQLIIDIPEIVELDINPLIADRAGVVALDARITVKPWLGEGERFAIQPYPKPLEETIRLPSGRTVQLRPIRPEDEPAHHAFLTRLTPEDIRFRYFGLVRDFPHSQLARQTQVDYDREMAFIATAHNPEGQPETLAEVRIVADPDNTQAEFAIVVRSDVKGQGLGRILLDKMIRYCNSRGTGKLVGQVLPDNHAMLHLAKSLGFKSRALPEGDAVEVRLALHSQVNGGLA
jgi:acetyltransferase